MSVSASIIGKGAIGSLIAAKCQQLGLPVNMWWRSGLAEKHTVQLLDASQQHLFPSQPEKTELLILPTKAWQVKDALRQYEKYLTEQTTIVLLHNGIGTEEDTLRCFPDNPILRMTTSQAALKISTTQVNETGQGTTQAGWLRETTAKKKVEIENWFNQVMSDCYWFDDIRIPLWQKLAINCVINPLTAIHDIKNGELRQPQYRESIEALLEEFFMVAELEEIPLDKQQITQQVWSVIEKTAQNYSSMHQDVMHGIKTEIEFINGYLIRIADTNTVELPKHLSLFNAVKNK